MTTDQRLDTTLTCWGPGGISEHVPVPATMRNADTSTCLYLLTAPRYHPVWSQYVISVVDLTVDRPDLGPPNLHFVDATHELLVMAVNPELGLLSPTRMVRRSEAGEAGFYLSPPNVGHQFTATAEEMTQLAWLLGRAVAHGQLNPETGDAPSLIREQWLGLCVRTLAHMRGEEHAGHDHH